MTVTWNSVRAARKRKRQLKGSDPATFCIEAAINFDVSWFISFVHAYELMFCKSLLRLVSIRRKL